MQLVLLMRPFSQQQFALVVGLNLLLLVLGQLLHHFHALRFRPELGVDLVEVLLLGLLLLLLLFLVLQLLILQLFGTDLLLFVHARYVALLLALFDGVLALHLLLV